MPFTYVFGMCPWQKHERNVHYKGMLFKGLQSGAESPRRITGECRTQRGSRDRLNVTKCHSWKLPPTMVLNGRPRTKTKRREICSLTWIINPGKKVKTRGCRIIKFMACVFVFCFTVKYKIISEWMSFKVSVIFQKTCQNGLIIWKLKDVSEMYCI